ncbi:hypothetical protein [Clostridium polynesiense]|uniref:hypothetical protein n=1 Tax=Clostridium polynesiense TaxID=1325933 RepID=UPI0006945452|nr:hypothetical protein [Clostridium polynesiense]
MKMLVLTFIVLFSAFNCNTAESVFAAEHFMGIEVSGSKDFHEASNPENIVILNAVNSSYSAAEGSAYFYEAPFPPSFPRTAVRIEAYNLPEPSSLGDFQGYEGVVFVPSEITWRFRMYPLSENGNKSWSGSFDLITYKLDNAEIQVRPYNIEKGKGGPVILKGLFRYNR